MHGRTLWHLIRQLVLHIIVYFLFGDIKREATYMCRRGNIGNCSDLIPVDSMQNSLNYRWLYKCINLPPDIFKDVKSTSPAHSPRFRFRWISLLFFFFSTDFVRLVQIGRTFKRLLSCRFPVDITTLNDSLLLFLSVRTPKDSGIWFW